MQTPFSMQPMSPHIRQWVAVALASLLCVAGAATLVFGYVWLPFVVIMAAIVAYFALGNVRIMLGTIVALITILPFGTLTLQGGYHAVVALVGHRLHYWQCASSTP